MSDIKRHSRPRAIDKQSAPPELHADLLNTAKEFWSVYRLPAGGRRRRELLALFKQHPLARLPVNNRWQANTVDPDLSVLLKRGTLKQVRSAGAKRHPLNRSSSKRQSYLVLA